MSSDEQSEDVDKESIEASESRSDVEEEQNPEMVAGYGDTQRTAGDFDEQFDTDPVGRALQELKTILAKTFGDRDPRVMESIKLLRNSTIRLPTLNMPLLAHAIYYVSRYGTNVNAENITAFVKANEKYGPLDTIRYIKFYVSLL